jgi:[protein-PII] uridylyltransferase
LGAVDAERFCKHHYLNKEDTDLVVFLVKHHLTMSNMAQKRDLSDPDTVIEFTELVKTERRLIALYLLTVADIRGTSPKVWNAWKGKLLEDLFKLTQRALGGTAPTRPQQLQERQEEAKRILRLYALGDHAHEAIWKTLDVGYFLRTDASDIAWHTRKLCWRVDSKQVVVKGRLSPIGEGLQVMVYCRDQPDLFARICGYFDSKNLSIMDAKIHTTNKGYALDSFMVSDFGQSGTYRELISMIENELTLRLETPSPLEPPVKGRISRQSKHFPIAPSVDIRPDERGQYHLLSVIATDRTGLLYSVACVLARHRINLHTAKITTLGERVEDSFLVGGEIFSSTKAQILLEKELLVVLND